MKVRTGFVSNSSSSSFCLLGYKLDNVTMEQKRNLIEKHLGKVVGHSDEAIDDYFYNIGQGEPSDLSVVLDDDRMYVGNLFAYWGGDSGMVPFEFDMGSLNYMAENLKSLGEVLEQTDAPKLYTGIVAS